jgi:CRISPR-associated protein Cas2
MTRQIATWRVLAYDVRDPRRLQRLHYRLQREACYLQESVALLRIDDMQLDALLRRLSPMLEDEGDVRVYRIDNLHDIWVFGPDPIPGTSLGLATAPLSRRRSRK